MAEDKEWYSLKEIAQMLDIPLRRLYGKVSVLRTAGTLDWKEDPEDQRAILINKSSLGLITTAVQETKAKTTKKPTAPFDIKRDDERLIIVSDAVEKYDVDEEWVKQHLTRIRFLSKKVTYIYIPELEYELDQVEFIPPGQEVGD
jgi:hypothetical protein